MITSAQKAGAAAALLVVAGLISYGLTDTGPEAPAGHVLVRFDGGVPAGMVAVWATVRGDPGAQALFGLAPPADGGTRPAYVYARARVCALEVDGGADPGPSLLPGLEVVYDDDQVGACAAGDPQLEAWVQGWRGPDGGWAAPFACACSTGASCTVGGSPAPTGLTLQPGWSGAGCYPKACVEMAGTSSWPAECPP